VIELLDFEIDTFAALAAENGDHHPLATEVTSDLRPVGGRP
jgi:hypothetical protein